MKFSLKCPNLYFKKNKTIKFEPTRDWLGPSLESLQRFHVKNYFIFDFAIWFNHLVLASWKWNSSFLESTSFRSPSSGSGSSGIGSSNSSTSGGPNIGSSGSGSGSGVPGNRSGKTPRSHQDDSEESGVGHEEDEEMQQLLVELLSLIRTPKVSIIKFDTFWPCKLYLRGLNSYMMIMEYGGVKFT